MLVLINSMEHNINFALIFIIDPRGIALDPENNRIYWADAGTRKVESATLTGSDRQTLATGLVEARDIALSVRNGYSCLLTIIIINIHFTHIYLHSISNSTIFISLAAYHTPQNSKV